MSSVAVRCYLEHFSPASLETTFTWTTNTRTQKLHWDPKFLATVSVIYEESKPSPTWTTFEINHRNTIKTDSAAYLFHNLISPCPGWDTKDDQRPEQLIEDAEFLDLKLDDNEDITHGIDDTYWALELCDFLQIEANDYAVKRVFATGPLHLIHYIIPCYEVFLRVRYQKGIEACENRFKEFMNAAIQDIPVHKRNRTEYLNEFHLCKIKAYIVFANNARGLSGETKTFFREVLGWEDHMERYGIWISLTDNQVIDL